MICAKNWNRRGIDALPKVRYCCPGERFGSFFIHLTAGFMKNVGNIKQPGPVYSGKIRPFAKSVGHAQGDECIVELKIGFEFKTREKNTDRVALQPAENLF